MSDPEGGKGLGRRRPETTTYVLRLPGKSNKGTPDGVGVRGEGGWGCFPGSR